MIRADIQIINNFFVLSSRLFFEILTNFGLLVEPEVDNNKKFLSFISFFYKFYFHTMKIYFPHEFLYIFFLRNGFSSEKIYLGQ